MSVIEPGKIRVSGNVETEGNKGQAENVLRSVKGVESVENAIRAVLLRPGARYPILLCSASPQPCDANRNIEARQPDNLLALSGIRSIEFVNCRRMRRGLDGALLF